MSVSASGPAIDPATTALLICDLQNDFVHPDGAYARGGAVSAQIAAVPPAVGPWLGPTAVTVGAVPWNSNSSSLDRSDIPPTVTTVTSTVSANSAGATAVMLVEELIVRERMAVPNDVTRLDGHALLHDLEEAEVLLRCLRAIKDCDAAFEGQPAPLALEDEQR